MGAVIFQGSHVTALKDQMQIGSSSFAAANNQAVAANVLGLLFSNTLTRSFEVVLSVTVDATSDLFEQFTLHGIQKGAGWDMSQTSVGDSSGFVFTITSGGQIQYTSANYSGFVSATIKFGSIITGT